MAAALPSHTGSAALSPPDCIPPSCASNGREATATERKEQQAARKARAEFGEAYGRPVFLRIIKENNLLELWIQDSSGTWGMTRGYPVAAWSGTLGPKLHEGDKQSPEGFYGVTPASLNPHSSFHLSFNIGYPNAYDRMLGRTGSYIMVHGGEVSVGCYAMTDPLIEEIYGMVEAALRRGQLWVPVQIYPFVMTPERMRREEGSPHICHWRYLYCGWQYTEANKAPYPPTHQPLCPFTSEPGVSP